MSLSFIAEKLKRQSNEDFKGQHFEAWLIVQTVTPVPTKICGSVRIDETYVTISGQWRYLYRSIDSRGNPIDFSLA